MAVSKVDAANQIENKLPQANIANNVNFRNIIINGDMSIAQRSTSTSSITTSAYHTIDRFQTSASSIGTWTQSQSTDVPSGQGFSSSLKMECTVADTSPAASDNLIIIQKFEGQNLQNLSKGTSAAKQLTLSFWVKSAKTGTYIASLFDRDNSRIVSKAYSVSTADTWENKSITFPADTTGTFDNDNAGSLDLQMWLAAGSDFSSGTLATTWESQTNANRAVGQVNLADSTSNDWYITGIQLEVGDTASDFEFLPYGINFARCQRYYYKSTEGNANTITMIGGVESASSAGVGGLNLPVEMRASPTLSFNSGVRFYSAGSGTRTPSISTNRSTPAVLSAAVGIAGGTAGQAGYIYRGAATGHVIGDAEL